MPPPATTIKRITLRNGFLGILFDMSKKLFMFHLYVPSGRPASISPGCTSLYFLQSDHTPLFSSVSPKNQQVAHTAPPAYVCHWLRFAFLSMQK